MSIESKQSQLWQSLIGNFPQRPRAARLSIWTRWCEPVSPGISQSSVSASHSVMSSSLPPLQAPLSMGFSSQEYWSGSPFPSPGDLPSPGVEPGSPTLQAECLLSEPPGKHSSLPASLQTRTHPASALPSTRSKADELRGERADLQFELGLNIPAPWSK